MKMDGNENNELFEEVAEQEETVSEVLFDDRWRNAEAIDYKVL